MDLYPNPPLQSTIPYHVMSVEDDVYQRVVSFDIESINDIKTMQPHNNLRCMWIGSSNFIFDDTSSLTDMHNVSINYAVGIS